MKISEPYTIFPRTLKSGKTVYYYQFRMENGLRSSAKSTGCTTLASAKKFCNKLYNEGAFKQYSYTRFDVFTKDFFSKQSEFYKWKIVNNYNITDETLLAYNKFLKNQLLPYFSNIQIKDISKSIVKEWIIWASDKWSAKTINNAQTVLNIILKQAVDKNIIMFNPAQGLSFRKVEKKKRNLLTISEIKLIYNSELWIRESDRTAFLLDVITGLRIGELIALKDENVKDGYLDICHSYSNIFGLGTTKTKKNRYVPIPKEFKFPDRNGYLFVGDNGFPTNIRTFYYHLTRIIDSVGINRKERGITTHTLRNFFISYLRSENISDAKIKAVVGHQDKDMTDWYTYWKPEMFPEVYEAQYKLYKQILEI